MNSFNATYVDGHWVESTSSETIEVVDPATGEAFASFRASSPDEVDRAVEAAAAALDSWSRTPVAERTELLTRVATEIGARSSELARTITRELGMPVKLCERIQVGLPRSTFASMADAAAAIAWREQLGTSLLLREAVGVVAAITPWNYPLHQIAAKVAAALAAGCTVVLKPSELTPKCAVDLFAIFDAVGFPPGVVNLVSGPGATVGERLVSHDLVDMVTFTGSTQVGRHISAIASQTVKRVALELGGKSPSVVLEDADLARAVRATVANCFLNSGQSCNALTRLIVPRERVEEAEELAAAAAARFAAGDPNDPEVRMGPLISENQRSRVNAYVEQALLDGAKVIGDGEVRSDNAKGFFVAPTVLSNVDPSMAIAREEVFGPVLCILASDSEDDAVRLANDSIYGLAAAVWSADEEHALRVASRIRAGQIQINDGPHNAIAPFGGYKQSGNGREYGSIGIEEFLEVKSLQMPA